MEDTPSLNRQRPPRGRGVLLLVAVLFGTPLLVAMLLRAAGWHPLQTRNFGSLVDPPISLEQTPPVDLSGQPLSWQVGERGWNLLVLAPAACAGDCAQLHETLHRVWLSQGRHAGRVRVLWIGPIPEQAAGYAGLVRAQADPAMIDRLPVIAATAQAPLYLVDSRGFLALRYPPGFDPSGLRKDLARLLK